MLSPWLATCSHPEPPLHCRVPHAEEPTPPIGSARLSYAKTLQLLNNRMVKRMTIMADGKLALVEVPIYMGGHDYDTQRYDASDFSALYAREFPEWRMEMLRYYVELPGDFWQESNLHRLIKQSLPQRTGDGCAPHRPQPHLHQERSHSAMPVLENAEPRRRCDRSAVVCSPAAVPPTRQ